MSKSEKQRMIAGELYRPADPELKAAVKRVRALTRQYNQTTEEQLDYREQLLQQIFAKTGKHPYVETQFKCEYGFNITVGDWFYANFDCIMLDIAPITIGNEVMLAPRVCLYTATHPIDADIRLSGLEYGAPITIGNRVWIGGSTVVNPGVTIGDNTVIGSGSVVTKDIPANVVAAGNPCRVIRPINADDQALWQAKKDQYFAE